MNTLLCIYCGAFFAGTLIALCSIVSGDGHVAIGGIRYMGEALPLGWGDQWG